MGSMGSHGSCSHNAFESWRLEMAVWIGRNSRDGNGPELNRSVARSSRRALGIAKPEGSETNALRQTNVERGVAACNEGSKMQKTLGPSRAEGSWI
jgi:hypothetical protein